MYTHCGCTRGKEAAESTANGVGGILGTVSSPLGCLVETSGPTPIYVERAS